MDEKVAQVVGLGGSADLEIDMETGDVSIVAERWVDVELTTYTWKLLNVVDVVTGR